MCQRDNVPWTSTAYPRASSQRTNNGTEWKSAGLDGMLYAQGDGGQGLRELDLSVNAEPSDIGWQGVSGVYDAVRCPEPGTLPGSPSVRDKVLMLCPFHEDYTKHWYYVSDKVAIEAAKSLVRMIDIASPQLVGQALYEHIRWTPYGHLNPLQIGDRVTLKGHSGKVIRIGTFFVTLQTLDDDLVSIPTRELWSEVLVSANAGARSSLCVMPFYLAPFVSKPQRQRAEDTIWDSMQASPYCETARPMQIYLSQTPDAICLTAKAYVTSTYDEPLFKSDVTRAFLDLASSKGIPLASSQWPVDTMAGYSQAASAAEETE